MRYRQVFEAVFNTPWLLTAEKMQTITQYLLGRARGDEAPEPSVVAYAGDRRQYQVHQGIGVLGLYGMLTQRAGLMQMMSGGTSTDAFAAEFSQAMNDPSVHTIVIDIDSPGGSTYGIQELSDRIYEARGNKPIIAVANSLAASAAYWVGSAADELVVTPGGDVGSIGVVAVHYDMSAAYEAAGVKPTIIKAGPYKAEGNEMQPLDDAAKEHLQHRVDETYDDFVTAVARNRGVSPSVVRSDFGQGRVVGAKAARAVGMVDRIGTLSHVLSGVYRSRSPKRTRKAYNRAILRMARLR